MTVAYEQLIHLLDEREVRYDSNDDSQSICADIRGDVGTFRVVAHVDEDAELFQVLGYVPNRVPQGSCPDIAEAVARANSGLRIGKFELDVDDGAICFHTSQVLVDDAVGEDVIDRLIYTTMAMLDRYVPAFLSVIYGNEEPKVAIACVEAGACRGEHASEDEGGDLL
jgi:hypothetical protein